MSVKAFLSFSLLTLFTVTSCSVNILQEFGDPDTDRAKFTDAKKAINDGSYDSAITLITGMTPNFQLREDVIELHASAYAGKCGLDFLSFMTVLSEMGSTRILLYLMQNRNGVTADTQAQCQTAIELIESISTDAASRTDDQNVFMAMVALLQIGNIVNLYGDTNDDGTADWSSEATDACSTIAISDLDVGHIGASLNRTLLSIQALTTQTIGGDQLSDIDSVCTSLAAAPISDTDICTKTDPTSFDATELRAYRTLLRESTDAGTGSCTGDLTTCLCP